MFHQRMILFPAVSLSDFVIGLATYCVNSNTTRRRRNAASALLAISVPSYCALHHSRKVTQFR